MKSCHGPHFGLLRRAKEEADDCTSIINNLVLIPPSNKCCIHYCSSCTQACRGSVHDSLHIPVRELVPNLRKMHKGLCQNVVDMQWNEWKKCTLAGAKTTRSPWSTFITATNASFSSLIPSTPLESPIFPIVRSWPYQQIIHCWVIFQNLLISNVYCITFFTRFTAVVLPQTQSEPSASTSESVFLRILTSQCSLSFGGRKFRTSLTTVWSSEKVVLCCIVEPSLCSVKDVVSSVVEPNFCNAIH